MGGEEAFLTCYNPGCPDKKFDPALNSDQSCKFHPSMPVFHDGIKRWPCCKRSSCDFTTLLAYPGCIQGKHNAEKPQAPAPQGDTNGVIEEDQRKEVIVEPSPPPKPIVKRIEVARDSSLPMVALHCKTMPSLAAALERMKVVDVATTNEKAGVPDQLECGNFGCNAKKTSNEVSEEAELINDCLHHPKPPVFHEGLQYWGCCQKKHIDFEKFRSQPGCTYGKHKWTKGVTKTTCRFDHFDNPKLLTLNIYAKNTDPEASTFSANNSILKVNVVYGAERLSFAKEFNLFNTIDPSQCMVTLNAAKVEIKLAKNPQGPWRAIEVLPEAEAEAPTGEDKL